MSHYETHGREQLDMYEAIIKSKSEDTKIVQTQDELIKYPPNQAFIDGRNIPDYNFRTHVVMTSDIDREPLSFRSSDVGFPIKNQQVHEITVGNQKGQVVNRSSYNTDGNSIVYSIAFKKANNDVRGHIPLNELGLQNFIRIAGPKTKNLQAVFLTNIQNKEF
ncbi:uncharacterized protein MYCFIDRAFT_77963 [Pseudocercospora fijiensis CIRAD86]|uniref:Uncharacterized protein n=1 Tax=Pseudocercospora fijiensis (strain CIRAD86) TaxID=383855 RepID=M3A6H6_PSEFD|nr:uncharacterized protein MYCFIDRAFT_77963 [Pseudocercospora fijiensis CIRAD86]EME80201.1 hypothetical protein MYCFIDRAFT_77963 [Pseudocercospora fijiensis CIRAD86]